MNKKLMIYDATDKSFTGFMWKVGATLFKSHFDTILAVDSYDDCYKKLAALKDKYSEVQFWGHGNPGKIYINNVPSQKDFWFELHKVLTPSSAIWLRVCSFAAKETGKDMMEWISGTLGTKVIAFTHIIGTWGVQSDMKSVSPNQTALWSSKEGVGKDGLLESRPWLPNTILATQMTLPKKTTNK